jgi:16S rRNA (adenine1518-N6/adenine1519-N6)-dimethyltransferase
VKPTNDPRSLLKDLEQRARRRFGQHFLTDEGVVRRMVGGARLNPGDRVVEIGPGLGILTEQLLASDVELTAVELDRDLAAYVRERFPQVRLIEGDAARVDWSEVTPGSGWKVVANLPYNVGTTVVMQIVRQPQTFASVTVMLQLEVVQRLMAEPGSKAFGALSVQAQARARPRFVLKLPPGAFHPPPKVDSAVIHFDVYPVPATGRCPAAHFDKVVRAGFAHRRKTLRNSLASSWGRERADAAITAAGIDPSSRGEQLDLAGYVRLAEADHDHLVSGDGGGLSETPGTEA